MVWVQLLLLAIAVAWIVRMIRADGRGRVRLLVRTVAAAVAVAAVPVALIDVGILWQGNRVPAALSSLPAYESREYWISDGFQDYTAYGKYRYAAPLTDESLQAAHFVPVQEGTAEQLAVYVEDCAGWVALYAENESNPHLVEAYDFDVQTITPGDYYHLRSDERTFDDGWHVLYSYDLYLYDAESAVVYYLHNNI